jgi:hypothetical protein
MQYLLLLYSDHSQWERMSDADQSEMLKLYNAYSQELVQAGAMRGGDELHPPHTATQLTMKDGVRHVQDGPFGATKETLGGYFLIEAPTLDAALDWAARCPGARHGTVEVRPVVQRG